MTPLQAERAAEKARKEKVNGYKKAIDEMEEESSLFYENRLRREEISAADYAAALKEKSRRYAEYSSDVLNVTYMTEAEKHDISREYILKSEKALTEHYEWIKKAEKELADCQNEQKRERLASLDSSMKISEKYLSDKNHFSDWEDDDPVSAFGRVDARLSQSVYSGDITREEYYDRLTAFGSQMYNDRIENSDRWLERQRELNAISAEEYLAGLERMQKYTEEYFSSGIISYREYIDGMQALEVRIFNEKTKMHKEILAQAEEEKAAADEAANAKIQLLKDEYNAKISSLEKSERAEELSYLKGQERIYENAQTKAGKSKLSSIREQIESIETAQRKIELKEQLDAETEHILELNVQKKNHIDRSAAEKALDLGLYYDEKSGYRLLSDIKGTFGSVLSEQESFTQKSATEMEQFSSSLNEQMVGSTQALSKNLLTSFSAFAEGINAIKNQIFSDVNAVNSLDFSRFGVSRGTGKTKIVYNDYGDKNISGSASYDGFFKTLGGLIAKGGGF